MVKYLIWDEKSIIFKYFIVSLKKYIFILLNFCRL